MKRVIPLLVALSLLAGCATGGVTLPPLPAWRAPADGRTALPALQVAAAVQSLAPAAALSYSDLTYTAVSKAWLDDYLTWTWSAAKAAGVDYTAESFDCEDFALGFAFFASRAAAKARVPAAPLIARLVVEWDAGQRHELIAVGTDEGIYIVEPQPDAGPFRTWPLASYPRRVLSVTLGDYNP